MGLYLSQVCESYVTAEGLHQLHTVNYKYTLRVEGAVSLNDLHLPTGYVTIEDILRFCIIDLGVQPLSQDWHEILQESYERFRTEFAPRGQP